jgi:hypothetical protein
MTVKFAVLLRDGSVRHVRAFDAFDALRFAESLSRVSAWGVSPAGSFQSA